MTSEVTDDDASIGRLSEKAFGARKIFPIGAFTTDGDILHGAVINYFFPKITEGRIEFGFVFGVTADVVF